MEYYQNFESQFKLVFSNGVASPVFTGKTLKATDDNGDGNEAIRISLIHTKTNQIFNSGPLAFARVKVVLLPGDFAGENWSRVDFQNSIITDWNNKKNILRGDVFVDLQDGRGVIGEIKIKHDRNNLRNVKFRLGAMVVECGDQVREGVSNRFEAKDIRNGPGKTNRVLRSNDKVGRLKNVGRVIRKRLVAAKITTVHHFLHMLSSDEPRLRQIYGSNGKKWKTTIDDAQSCIMVNDIQQQNMVVQNFDPDNLEFLDVKTHVPFPCSSWPSSMIIDQNFSIQDMQLDEYGPHENIILHESKGMVRKRWTKLYKVWWSMKSFTKKVGGAVGVGVCTSANGVVLPDRQI